MDANGNENNLWKNIIKWYAHPFNTEGSAANWFWFAGLLFIIAWMWSRIVAAILD